MAPVLDQEKMPAPDQINPGIEAVVADAKLKHHGSDPLADQTMEIGRASCRERVSSPV